MLKKYLKICHSFDALYVMFVCLWILHIVQMEYNEQKEKEKENVTTSTNQISTSILSKEELNREENNI